MMILDEDAFVRGVQSLSGLMRLAMGEGRVCIQVRGTCLEGSGVEDGDLVSVDFTRMPRPPRYRQEEGPASFDVCLCYARHPSAAAPALLLKRYDGLWGDWQMVSTHYRQRAGEKYRLNASFRAAAILGVAYECRNRDGGLKWRRDLLQFPRELEPGSAIHSAQCGAPKAVSADRSFRAEGETLIWR